MKSEELRERTAQLLAHRACCGVEHDPPNGKLHGYCVVCGVPWPCAYAGSPPESLPAPGEAVEAVVKECLELSDNWPGIAYSDDLKARCRKLVGT